MTATGARPDTLTGVLDLSPAISARSAEIERARSIPADLLAALTDTGCFRMLSPRRYGGSELALSDAVRVVGALARADAAVGWAVGQHCSAQLLLAALPAAALADVYADGPDVRCAGAVAPKGRARAAGLGWRVSGRWPFVTGCAWSSWIYANCVVLDGAAAPQVRMVLFPASDVQIIDTWTVTGLRGTGSHDVVIQGVCPPERTCALPGDAGSVVLEHPQLLHGSFFLAAVSLGIAHRAVDEVLAAAGSAAPVTAPVTALGTAHMALRAAAALLDGQVAAGATSPLARAEALATAHTVTATAKRVVTDLFTAAGSAAIYERSPLQRQLRDIHVAGQHFLNRPHTLAAVGTALLG